MFEKEAEEYAKDCEKEFHTSYGACLHSFKDGAEFGYNKGLEAGMSKVNTYFKKYNLAGFSKSDMRYLVENDMVSPFQTKEQQEALKLLLDFNKKIGNIK